MVIGAGGSDYGAGGFPARRLRRSRRYAWSRRLTAENRLSPADLILPIFLCEGQKCRRPVAAMPGVERISVDLLAAETENAAALGIPLIALFPDIEPAARDQRGSAAFDPNGLVCRAIAAIRKRDLPVGVMVDVALDPYTSHGHDGVLIDDQVDNDATIEALVLQSRVLAEAGADALAPSDMMDGRIGAIRRMLEARGHHDILLISYAAKYASAYYGPFRDAIQTVDRLHGDKRTYQMDPANGNEALLEATLDLAEGADMIIVKPGLPYLDVLYRVTQMARIPVLAYQVSGEYSQIKAAAENTWCDQNSMMLETLLAFKRAGARAIITYFAREAARVL